MEPQTDKQTKITRQSDADILAAERVSDTGIEEATRTSDAKVLAVSRRQGINMIWERTQQGIAILCVSASVFTSVYVCLYGRDPLTERGFQFLTNVGLLVIGFYFGRTNHTRPTGEKD